MLNRYLVCRAKTGRALRKTWMYFFFFVVGLEEGFLLLLVSPLGDFSLSSNARKIEPRGTQPEAIWVEGAGWQEILCRLPAPRRWRVAWLTLVIAEVLRLNSVEKHSFVRPFLEWCSP